MTSPSPQPNPYRVFVAVPGPFLQPLTYLFKAPVPVGSRCLVPLGSREVVGICVEAPKSGLPVDVNKLKPIIRCLDAKPILPKAIIELAQWVSRYYLHDYSSALLMALPAGLRKPNEASLTATPWLHLTIAGEAIDPNQLTRSAIQKHFIAWLQQHAPCSLLTARTAGFNRAHATALIKKGLVFIKDHQSSDEITPSSKLGEAALTLNDEQHAALNQITDNSFNATLIEGVTGSGKTEIYLQAIERCLQAGKRALVLVPEINLTPQTIARFTTRFQTPIATLHSGLGDTKRTQQWLTAAFGQASIVIGTRSAVLSPIPNLGLIVIDEEHDASFKQQDGLRYHARDVALKRAQLANIPIILGSATPAIETLHNAHSGKFQHAQLQRRASGNRLPTIETIDMRTQEQTLGLSERLLARIQEHLDGNNQVIIFLARRGYAPAWFCQSCGTMSDCPFCDARLTHHKALRTNICHHCGYQEPPIKHCPSCHQPNMSAMGTGTERAEEILEQHFNVPIIRFDRDAANSPKKLQTQLDKAQQDGSAILIGTQMLAKGHHFERVTLVGIWDIDTGLFSADLRARERMGQLLVQVAGRAGRGKRAGEVLLQTYHPQDPLFEPLLKHDYSSFAQGILTQRQHSQLPPFSHLAMIRCDSPFTDRALAQLGEMSHRLSGVSELTLLGPLPALMSRRAGRHRFILMVQSQKRSALHRALAPLIEQFPREANQVSWHIDIDPIEFS